MSSLNIYHIIRNKIENGRLGKNIYMRYTSIHQTQQALKVLINYINMLKKIISFEFHIPKLRKWLQKQNAYSA